MRYRSVTRWDQPLLGLVKPEVGLAKHAWFTADVLFGAVLLTEVRVNIRAVQLMKSAGLFSAQATATSQVIRRLL